MECRKERGLSLLRDDGPLLDVRLISVVHLSPPAILHSTKLMALPHRLYHTPSPLLGLNKHHLFTEVQNSSTNNVPS